MPANTKVEICNLGHGHIGIDKDISSLTENSKEARVANKWIDIVILEVLRNHNWGFARKYATLALVEENPTIEWGYSYRYPSDCMFMRRLLNGVTTRNLDWADNFSFQNSYAQTLIPWQEGQDSEGKLIYTNMADAQCEYTVQVDNGLFWPPDFVIACSYLYAAYVAPSLTGGDPFKLGPAAMNMYQDKITIAAANAANESQPLITNESGFTRSRY